MRPGNGKIDTGKSFQLALNGAAIVPGELTLLELPPELAIADAPVETQFFGSVFFLSAG
jgi:hypothetical protein